MTTTEQTFFIANPAEEIAELVEREELKLEKAKQKQHKHEPENKKAKPSSKWLAAKRDEHRAQTSLMAYKQALQIVLQAEACRKASGPQPMEDPDEYLAKRRRQPLV